MFLRAGALARLMNPSGALTLLFFLYYFTIIQKMHSIVYIRPYGVYTHRLYYLTIRTSVVGNYQLLYTTNKIVKKDVQKGNKVHCMHCILQILRRHF